MRRRIASRRPVSMTTVGIAFAFCRKMAKFVLAGRADCPYYAKAELLADYLHKSLPCFHVHKMTQHPEDWEDWLKEVCKKNGWSHQRSPIIWRELVDRGGKGMLVGGFNEFFEHSQEYYNITFDLMSDLMKQIAVENLETHIETKKEQEEIQSLFDPLHVWITSATVPTCYNLIPHLASGDVFGMGKEIWLHLLDSNHDSETLRALVMEAEDLAFPLLRKITVHKIASDAFLQADVVIFLDDTYAKNDLSQEQCLRKIAEQFTQYGALIDQSSNKEVKVVVAGSSYVNLKALILLSSAPSINTHNIVALPTQLEFEAKAQIAKKLNINSSAVKDVILWGNISGINYLDLSHAKIFQYDSAIWGPPSFFRPLKNLIYDRKWLKNEFLQERSRKSQHRSGMSAAHCIATVLSWWQKDSNPEEIVSLGVVSEGQFGLPEGIIYSMPVQFKNGVWHIYAQAVLPSEEKLIEAAADLIKEKEIALGIHQKTEIAIDGSKETTKVTEPEEILPTALNTEVCLNNVENLSSTKEDTVTPASPFIETTALGEQVKSNQGDLPAIIPSSEPLELDGDKTFTVLSPSVTLTTEESSSKEENSKLAP